MEYNKNELILLGNKGREAFEEKVWDEDTDELIKKYEKSLKTFGAKLALSVKITLKDIYNFDQHIHNHFVLSAKEVNLDPAHFIDICIAYELYGEK